MGTTLLTTCDLCKPDAEGHHSRVVLCPVHGEGVHPELDLAIAFTQRNSCTLYESARSLYSRSRSFPSLAITTLQRLAAEAAHHSRWLAGVEPRCSCVASGLGDGLEPHELADVRTLTTDSKCDNCGKPEAFNVLCPECEELCCNECGRVECCCGGEERLDYQGKTS